MPIQMQELDTWLTRIGNWADKTHGKEGINLSVWRTLRDQEV